MAAVLPSQAPLTRFTVWDAQKFRIIGHASSASGLTGPEAFEGLEYHKRRRRRARQWNPVNAAAFLCQKSVLVMMAVTNQYLTQNNHDSLRVPLTVRPPRRGLELGEMRWPLAWPELPATPLLETSSESLE